MKDGIIAAATVIGLLVFLFIVCIGLCYIEDAADESTWNNGFCDNCGGEWVFTNGSHSKYGTRYYYSCKDCGKVMYLYYPRTRDN